MRNSRIALDRGTGTSTRVALVISSLEHGGAERQAVELVRNLDRHRFDPVIVSLSRHVPLADLLPDPEHDLVIVEKKWKYDFSTVRRVARLLEQRQVAIAHGFLFDAEMVTRLAARIAGVPVVVASERNADYERPLIHSLCQRLTRSWYDVLVANSHAGRRFAMRSLGLPGGRVHVVHNGVDVQRFRPGDPEAARRALGIPTGGLVVGMVANFKPQKNHMMFLQMARRVLAQIPDIRFVCIGEKLRVEGNGALSLRSGAGGHGDVDAYHRMIANAIEAYGLSGRVLLLGHCRDIVTAYNACDLTVLTSRHEGTPNVLLESMACGVPVVATDVSDNATVVPDGDVGFVVPLDDADRFSCRVCDLLVDSERRRRMGKAACRWVEDEFSTATLARRTEAIYADALRGKLRADSQATKMAPPSRVRRAKTGKRRS